MDLGADESFEIRKLLRFRTTEVIFAADKQVAGCKEIMSHDEDIFTLNVDGEALEEEMECEPWEETARSRKVRTISDLGQPSKKEREEHEATHEQFRSWCIVCVRGRGIATKHHRSIGAESDEGTLHSFVMDYCWCSSRSHQSVHSNVANGRDNEV